MMPMTTRQWARVERLFTEAVRLDRSQRNGYLKRACRSTGIRREVESLLDQHDKGENRLGVYSSVGGKVLSHYEVGERLGEGGMASVYKARDTRLKRWVALKVLQPWAMGHASFREQLIQEAQLISALNHPHIVTVHEVAARAWLGKSLRSS
jgi:serine/threonine protein kinase